MAAQLDGIERFNATVLADNGPARGILDRYGAEWIRDEAGVVTTTIPVPRTDQLPLDATKISEVARMARQVIGAFD